MRVCIKCLKTCLKTCLTIYIDCMQGNIDIVLMVIGDSHDNSV